MRAGNLFTDLEIVVLSSSPVCPYRQSGKGDARREEEGAIRWTGKRNGTLITVYTRKDNYQLKTNFRGIYILLADGIHGLAKAFSDYAHGYL